MARLWHVSAVAGAKLPASTSPCQVAEVRGCAPLLALLVLGIMR